MLQREIVIEQPGASYQYSLFLPFINGLSVIDRHISNPPSGAARGDAYIVGLAGTGDWSGFDDAVVWWDEGWFFFRPWRGYQCWVIDEGAPLMWNGASWVNVSIS